MRQPSHWWCNEAVQGLLTVFPHACGQVRPRGYWENLSTLLGQGAVLKASPKVPKSPEIGRIIPLDLDGQTLRLILYLHDGTHLRLTEQGNEDALGHDSYYWLTTTNELKIGWDNVPHHICLATFSHHKRDGHQRNIQPSTETRLEEVMTFIRTAET